MRPWGADLGGRVAVVTGAARGIGAAVADRLERDGAVVSRWDLGPWDPDPGTAHRLVADVRDDAAVEAALERVERELGPVAVLVNNAGVLHLGSVLDSRHDDLAHMLDVNVAGVVRVSRAVARRMVGRGDGTIVTVASNSSTTPRVSMSGYCASKAASTIFTQAMGLELAEHGIRCNVVAPGSTRTDMQRQLWSGPDGEHRAVAGSPEAFKLGIPLGRIAEPDDVADTVSFLASDRARHITMQRLVIDGGATLGV